MEDQQHLVFEKSQEEFDFYIAKLPDKECCKYMEDVHGIVNLCSCYFSCRFQEKISFEFHSKAKHECKRPHYLKLKKML